MSTKVEVLTPDGIRLAAHCDGAGEPVLLLHGLGFTQSLWETARATLEEANFRANYKLFSPEGAAALAEALARRLRAGERRALGFAEAMAARPVICAAPEAVFRNLNRWRDLEPPGA